MSEIVWMVTGAKGGRTRTKSPIRVPLSVWTFVLVASLCGGMTIARSLIAIEQAVTHRSVTGVALALLAMAAGPFSITSSTETVNEAEVGDDDAAA